MKIKFAVLVVLSFLLLPATWIERLAYSQEKRTPIEFLKEQERRHKEAKGEVYLGKVMTLHYPSNATEPDDKHHPFLLELTDVLKTPLRKNYWLVLKGYSDDSGSIDQNRRLSIERAETLKTLLINKYYMKEKRISSRGLGEKGSIASNKSAEGRKKNRRVEIHVYGDVTEAVRFLDQ